MTTIPPLAPSACVGLAPTPKPRKRTKPNGCFHIIACVLLTAMSVQAQGTAFTYQGRLNEGANPASGSYDLQFGLWNAASGPAQVGSTLNRTATPVSNGVFTVTLDFGN